ncbi:MAG TPA: CsgG/HfaB family protein [Vicinamibacterales bacterium]|nr:CsgG/HfaB family protein [Vicinamibacterales bacterium]
MKRISLILVFSSAALAVGAVRAQEPAPAKPTMTVADFDTDRTGWMPPPRLGTTIAELLTDRLVAAGPYRMMDRQWLASAPDDRSHIPFAALIERAANAGVDYLIAGSVTRLSIEEHSSTVGGAVPLPIVGGLFHKHKTESVIGLTIRVIDVHSGEVVATSTAERGATQQNSAGGGFAVVGHVPLPVFGAGGSSSTGFQDRLLDSAMQEAVTAAADRIVSAAPRLTRASGKHEGHEGR